MIRYLSDENEIVKLFPLFIEEGKANGEDVTKLNPDKLWVMVKNCMDNAAIIIDEDKGVVTGCMVIVPVEKYWCDEITLTNLLYYVLPAHRQSGIGAALLKEALNYSDKVGRVFYLMVESYEDLDRKDKFFQRKGLKRCGGSYIYNGVKNAN